MTIPPNGEYNMFFQKGSEHILVGGYDIPPNEEENAHLSLFYDTDEKGFFVVRIVSDDGNGGSTTKAGDHSFHHRIFRLSGEKLQKFFELNPQLREAAESILRQDGR
jgi:hypothetical protein